MKNIQTIINTIVTFLVNFNKLYDNSNLLHVLLNIKQDIFSKPKYIHIHI